MKKKRFSEEQIIAVLKEAEAGAKLKRIVADQQLDISALKDLLARLRLSFAIASPSSRRRSAATAIGAFTCCFAGRAGR